MQFNVSTMTAIGRFEPRDLFRPITVAVCKNKLIAEMESLLLLTNYDQEVRNMNKR